MLLANLKGTPNSKLRQIRQVINVSLLCVIILNMMVSVSGSVMFGTETMPNILSNFPSTNILGSLVKCMMLIVMVCSFPLVMAINVNGVEEMYGRPMSLRLRSIWVVVLTLGVAVIGSLVDSITTVISLMSATSGSVVYFIIPGLMSCYLPTTKHDAPVLGKASDPETQAEREAERERERLAELEEGRTSSLLAVVGMLSDVDIVRQRASLAEVVRDRMASMARATSFADMRRISFLASQSRQLARERYRDKARRMEVGLPPKEELAQEAPIRGTEEYLGRSRAMTALVLERAEGKEYELDRVRERSRKKKLPGDCDPVPEEGEREKEEPAVVIPPPSPMRGTGSGSVAIASISMDNVGQGWLRGNATKGSIAVSRLSYEAEPDLDRSDSDTEGGLERDAYMPEVEAEQVWEPDLDNPAVSFLINRAVQLETGAYDGEREREIETGAEVVDSARVSYAEPECSMVSTDIPYTEDTDRETDREAEGERVEEGARGSVVASRSRSVARPSRLSSVVEVPLEDESETQQETEGEGEGEKKKAKRQQRQRPRRMSVAAALGLQFHATPQGVFLIGMGMCNMVLKLRTFF
ncbi:hypothetical protein KIPB_006540 [Kipferlia bialata]|uniref:Amino acid transporter transmembrane domain-containing protein n=1 Tax=Kipferlia bialata TaxID=797122 RepID=A0A9K3D0E0_9EUKA|nr:hypothetical protein KIPB_006540 [Kipferlia bialata]|eukprot:g6540.t1